jgi:hypothetical protein
MVLRKVYLQSYCELVNGKELNAGFEPESYLNKTEWYMKFGRKLK